MVRSLRTCGFVAGLWIVTAGALSETTAAQGKKTTQAEHGQQLFEHVWESGHGADAGGDGLGPLFNERSCIACHRMGGIGGAGPNENNVTILTAVVPENVPDKDLFQARLAVLHPGLANDTSVVLHQFSTDPVAYRSFCESLLGPDARHGGDPVLQVVSTRVIVRKESQGPTRVIEVDGTTLLLAQRNTTPLFGMGLIDSIPQAAIVAAAAIETSENPRVHGRFLGRFGWRGQMITLKEFVRGACAAELGLQVSTAAQAVDPVAAPAPQPAIKQLDLTDRQCDEMTSFVGRLPAPRRLQPADHQQAAAVREGEQFFRSVGCAVCHRPKLGNVKGIYSDLLVHAMGSQLVDPMPAPLSLAVAAATGPRASSYYGGGSAPTVSPPAVDSYTRLQEWKTPPLWGLRDSAPYLHDGRAQTVEEAIVCHAGEAADSVDRYLALSTNARTRLLAFLATLAAPDPASLPKLKATDDRLPVPAKPRKRQPAPGFAAASL
ncbi:MAG TPA: di-heme oxidoredictase family protein [Pirellulales bacterium]|jgi:CxxC motif-containing protein (DUF1111 family)|nr:di-heme oxidoredictase family protein [Pirellulales bacterium]